MLIYWTRGRYCCLRGRSNSSRVVSKRVWLRSSEIILLKQKTRLISYKKWERTYLIVKLQVKISLDKFYSNHTSKLISTPNSVCKWSRLMAEYKTYKRLCKRHRTCWPKSNQKWKRYCESKRSLLRRKTCYSWESTQQKNWKIRLRGRSFSKRKFSSWDSNWRWIKKNSRMQTKTLRLYWSNSKKLTNNLWRSRTTSHLSNLKLRRRLARLRVLDKKRK